MGNSCFDPQQWRPNFSVDLRKSFAQYKAVVEYMRGSHLFATNHDELRNVVGQYLADPQHFSRQEMALNCVHAVHKLHPLDYKTSKVTVDWLMDACVRQHKFAVEFPLNKLSFQACYKEYAQFLYICTMNKRSVTVPNKMADFMWHSHMQSHKAYQNDTKKMLGNVLNHTDDYSAQQLHNYSVKTEKLRKEHFVIPHASTKRRYAAERHGMIDYGPAVYWVDPGPINPAPFDGADNNSCDGGDGGAACDVPGHGDCEGGSAGGNDCGDGGDAGGGDAGCGGDGGGGGCGGGCGGCGGD